MWRPPLLQSVPVMADSYKPLVIIGPTASGKSDLAMAVARRHGAEILSVDSMQVYRGMDLGTAKPTAAERAQVRHHVIDVVGASEPFTVARYVELADDAIADAARRGVPLLATGGTPLYYKALFDGLFEGPGADAAIRQQLRERGNAELHAQLSRVDPAAAARIHVNDTKRLVRALEVHALTGRPISSLQTEWSSPGRRHEAVWVGLRWERETLNRRINARVKLMIQAGWLEEARRLLEQEGGLSPTAAEATGYRELIDHLQGRISLEEAMERIKIATRQLARRQMKWFKRFPQVHWLAGEQAVEVLCEETLRIWSLEGDCGNAKEGAVG
jgi:tRNA dimethylallyltransferase